MSSVYKEPTKFFGENILTTCSADAGPGVAYACGPCDPADLARFARECGSTVRGNYHEDRWKLSLRREGQEGALRILPIERWLGRQDVPQDVARATMEALGKALVARFGQRICATPAETGFWAWKESVGYYPPLPEAIRDAFVGTQGRFEVCPAVETIPALYCLDMRLAYAAAALNVQSSPQWRHEEPSGGVWLVPDEQSASTVAGFLGYTPARYKVRFRAPAGWGHVGLLPATGYPLEGDAWADGTEVRLAIEHGWQIEVMERIYAVREPGRASWRKPLSPWANGLLAIRDTPPRGIDADLWQNACRNIILHTIGLMAGKSRMETRTVRREDGEWADWSDVPSNAVPGSEVERGVDILYQSVNRVGSSVFRHPELAHQIWGRTRAALLSAHQAVNGARRRVGALHVPREQVVAFSQDALYLTAEPGWPDDGKNGRYRVKGVGQRPHSSPRNRAELLTMMGGGGD